jgi:hypothetical protein
MPVARARSHCMQGAAEPANLSARARGRGGRRGGAGVGPVCDGGSESGSGRQGAGDSLQLLSNVSP